VQRIYSLSSKKAKGARNIASFFNLGNVVGKLNRIQFHLRQNTWVDGSVSQGVHWVCWVVESIESLGPLGLLGRWVESLLGPWVIGSLSRWVYWVVESRVEGRGSVGSIGSVGG